MSALAAHGRDAAWAGTLECSGPCRRKRLIAAEFSKAQVQRQQKDPNATVKCKQCVEAVAAEERAQAAARQAERARAAAEKPPEQDQGSSSAIDVSDDAVPAQPSAPATHECSACLKQLPSDAFNRTQLVKGAGKQRCRECVEASEKASGDAAAQKQDAGIEEARKALQKAEVSGSVAEKLAASAKLAALEGEKVTGLKPMVLGKGGRGRGSWRGRSGRGGK